MVGRTEDATAVVPKAFGDQKEWLILGRPSLDLTLDHRLHDAVDGEDGVTTFLGDWGAEVLRITDNAGAEHVVEVGGTDTFPKSLRAVAVNGTVSVIGGVSGFGSEASLRDILSKMSLIRGIFVGSRAMFEAMNRALTRARTNPVIDRVFPFADAPAAYRHQQSGAHFGKVVISHG